MGNKTYSSMDKCMHDWKKDHPKGRGKNVKDPHEQAVAVCLSKTGKSTNEGVSFKEYLEEMTYGDQSAPHYKAVQVATDEAKKTGKNIIVARQIDPKTLEKTYVPVGIGKPIPAGFDIWAEITPRGKVRRVRMYQ